MTSFSSSMTFELVGDDYPESWSFLTGAPLPLQAVPTHSLAFDAARTVSGKPDYPHRKRGLWSRLNGVNRKAHRQWRREVAEWVAAGRPDKEIQVRYYFPRVRLT